MLLTRETLHSNLFVKEIKLNGLKNLGLVFLEEEKRDTNGLKTENSNDTTNQSLSMQVVKVLLI